jgi:hypothetical protein
MDTDPVVAVVVVVGSHTNSQGLGVAADKSRL